MRDKLCHFTVRLLFQPFLLFFTSFLWTIQSVSPERSGVQYFLLFLFTFCYITKVSNKRKKKKNVSRQWRIFEWIIWNTWSDCWVTLRYIVNNWKMILHRKICNDFDIRSSLKQERNVIIFDSEIDFEEEWMENDILPNLENYINIYDVTSVWRSTKYKWSN